MRFLLHPAIRSTKSSRRELPRRSVAADSVKVTTVSSKNDTLSKTWGQQCSPNCGCVVRFEATIDPATQTIVDATYNAKSIVSIEKNGRLEPVRTARTNRPMLKDCKCKTVHTLAKEITSFVANKNLDRVRNMSEFSFTRSSPAFRHAVLVSNQLPRTDTHCFDVLEEAYTAMIKGFLPRQRQNMSSFDKILTADFVWDAPTDYDEILASTARRRSATSIKPLSMSTPRAVSTLSMFDINAEYWENEEFHKAEEEEKQQRKKSLDWLSFVDEQNQNEKWA